MTENNLFKLMKQYDSDAWYILNTQKSMGDDISVWLNRTRLVECVEIAVHEEFHAYTHKNGTFDFTGRSDKYYLGKKKSSQVWYTNVFKTELATKKIPKKYRTFRYNTYVSEGASPSSNQNGVYGLLNEFCAYYWGMHAMESLYPYFKSKAKTASDWFAFINNFCNGRNAYTEFYYYTLVYLNYAKSREPAVYKEIMENKSYIQTFYTMQKNYEKLIKKYEKDLDALSKKYNGSGWKANFSNGMLHLGSLGCGTSDDYSVLLPQIQSKKYKAVRNDIAKYAKK